VDNPTTRSDLSPPPFSTDLFPTFTQLIYIVIHRAEGEIKAIKISVWACAPWMGAQTLCYSILVARAPLQGAHTCLVRTGGIRYAQTCYWAETPSASFLPSGWCEQGSRKSVKVWEVCVRINKTFGNNIAVTPRTLTYPLRSFVARPPSFPPLSGDRNP
jgi:hypothetical protein